MMMTKAVEQRSESPGSEVKEPKTPQEQFLNDLYGKIYDWLIRKQHGKVLAKFGPHEIDSWDSYEADPGSITRLDIDLQKAVIIETKDRQFALALGRKQHIRFDGQTLHLQFGATPLPLSKWDIEGGNLIDRVRQLVNQSHGWGSGEFYIDDVTKKVDLDCWADNGMYTGGRDIGTWPHKWTQEKLMSEQGLNACLDIVQRTSHQAFLR